MLKRKFVALCFVFSATLSLVGVSAVEAQSRERTLGFTTSKARTINVRPTNTVVASGRCAQLHAQAHKLDRRKTALLKSRKWAPSQLTEIARNFGEAEKNLTISIQRCEQN